ncbi:MAG: hypothetical protein VW871_04850 [Gammaproteobacteria bacterium]|jgi:hypothetical protein
MIYKILLTLIISCNLIAAEFSDYEAKYLFKSDEINIKGIRKFKRTGDDIDIDFKARNWLASINISSKFKYKNGNIISEQYNAKVKPEFVNRSQNIKFDYENQRIIGKGRFSWDVPLDKSIPTTDPLNAQLQIRLNLMKGLDEFSIKLIEIKTGGIKDNIYKVVDKQNCVLKDKSYECILLQRYRESDKRETTYYIIPELEYMFYKIIDKRPDKLETLEMIELLSFG